MDYRIPPPGQSYNSFHEKETKKIDREINKSFIFLTIFSISIFVISTILIKQSQDLRQRAETPSINQDAAPDEILLKFKPGAKQNIKNKILSLHALSVKEEIKQIDVKVVKVAPTSRDYVVEALSHNPAIDFAETNKILKTQLVPNDPYFSQEWHLADIQTPAAWDSTKATGVLIAMCDTGVNQVADLTPALRTDLGWNAVDGTSDWSDPIGHGTSTAGVIAAATDNGIGVAGVAWGAQIIPVRVSNLSGGNAYISDIIKCINYGADNGARVINVSYDVAGDSGVDAAGQYAQSRGGLLFAAAGNSASDPGYQNYPGIIAVSATAGTNLTGFSSFGNFIDLSAPGTNIYSTKFDGTFWPVSGTSVASPVAGGVAALVFGIKPQFTALQVQNILFQNSDDLGAPGYDVQFGWGKINAAKAVAAALGTTPTDTTAPATSISSPTSGSTISGLVPINADATDNVGVARVELYFENPGGTPYAVDTTSPYSFIWDTTQVSNGQHLIYTKAYDTAGNTTTSNGISLTVNNTLPTPTPTITPTFAPTSTLAPTQTPFPTATIKPTPTTTSQDKTAPVVTIIFPLAGSTVGVRTNINITATAIDNVGVTKVEFYVNGTLNCSDSASPYTCGWKVPASKNKTYTLAAKAYDAAGNFSGGSISVTAK